MADSPAAGGIGVVVGDSSVADPGRRAIRRPRQARGVEGVIQRENGIDGEVRGGADGAAGLAADEDAIRAGLAGLHAGENEVGGVDASEARAIGEVEAVALPLVSERRRAGDGDAEAGAVAGINAPAPGRHGDGGRDRAEGDLIQPRAILAGDAAGTFRVSPGEGLIAGANVEGTELPVRLA